MSDFLRELERLIWTLEFGVYTIVGLLIWYGLSILFVHLLFSRGRDPFAAATAGIVLALFFSSMLIAAYALWTSPARPLFALLAALVVFIVGLLLILALRRQPAQAGG